MHSGHVVHPVQRRYECFSDGAASLGNFPVLTATLSRWLRLTKSPKTYLVLVYTGREDIPGWGV